MGWIARVILRIRDLAAERRILLTAKAVEELALLDLDEEDLREILERLAVEDSAGRVVSERTGEWLYVFKLVVGDARLYVKVVLRGVCVVVSCHEDEGGRHEKH